MNEKKDLILCIDNTYSMVNMIDRVIEYLPRFVVHVADNIDRLGLVLIGDHPELTLDEKDIPCVVYGLTENLEEYVYWIKNIRVHGGGDLAESISCAVNEARKLSDNSLIWIITDACPHHSSGLRDSDDFINIWDGCSYCSNYPSFEDCAVLFPISSRDGYIEKARDAWSYINTRGFVDFSSIFCKEPNEEEIDNLFEGVKE